MPQTFTPICEVCQRPLPDHWGLDLCWRCLKIEEGEEL